MSDLAKSLVSLYKSDLAPIEDIENLDFRSKKDYKKINLIFQNQMIKIQAIKEKKEEEKK